LNLLLRLHRFGKYALSADQIAAANTIGVMMLVTIGGLVAWLGFKYEPGMIIAAVSGLLMIPASAIFTCEKGWPRWTMMGVCALLAWVGGAVVATTILASRGLESTPVQNALLLFFLFGAIASQFVANWLRTVRVRT
jgi:uncharacterized membrane protein (UPF0136 family)